MTDRFGRMLVVFVAVVLATVAVFLVTRGGSPNGQSLAAGGQVQGPVGRQLQPHVAGGGLVALQPGEVEAMILYAGPTHGTIEACGCDGNVSGGLTKELTVVNWLRAKGLPTLYVHPGDLFPYKKLPQKLPFVAEAASHMGYDAIGVGDQEFRGGSEKLHELATKYGLPLLSENLRDAGGGRVAPGYVIKELAGIRVGIFSVVSDEWYVFDKDAFPKGMTIEPTRSAIAGVLEALADQVDFTILLSHQDRSIDRKIAREFPQINLIVGGHDERMIGHPIRVGHTLIVNAGVAGDYVGVIHLGVKAAGHVRVLASEFAAASGVVPKNETIEKIYRRYVKTSGVVPESYGEYDPEVYQTSLTCEPCHKKIYQKFMTTKHAQAWQTLVKANRTDDRECWSCHSMGFGHKTGFKDIKQTPQLANISCQSCHPVTHDHNDLEIKADLDFALNQKACERCHTARHSPDFNYWEDVEEVDHHDVKEKSNDPPAGYKHWLAVPGKKKSGAKAKKPATGAAQPAKKN